MQLVKPSIKFRWITSEPLKTIESAGRTCYRSEEKITEHSAEAFARMLIKRRHHAMIEHASTSYRVICDRGITHEIVRHRLFSYAQESTRYCNYKGGVTFIIPPWIVIPTGELLSETEHNWTCNGNTLCVDEQLPMVVWLDALLLCEMSYQQLLEKGWTPQQARSVLPNSLKTEIVITGNLREWLHFFRLRTAKAAHPQMREIADMLLKDMKKHVPVIFEGIPE